MSRTIRLRYSLARNIARVPTAIACALLAACAALLPESIGFTAVELEARLAERMPLRRDILGLFDLELSRAAVALDPLEQRVTATFAITVRTTLSTRILPGTIRLSGIPRYDGAARAIMLDQARVDTFELDGLPRAFSDRLNEVAMLVAKDVFDRRPLYTVKPEQLQWGGMKLTPRGARIVGDRLLIDLGPADSGGR
ncbi:MAG: DUF1439 domain-containing protein [Burkholderiales bacterium]